MTSDMSEYPAFWCEPTDRQAVYLRRWVPGRYDPETKLYQNECPQGIHGYHHAPKVRIEDQPVVMRGSGDDRSYASPLEAPHDDPRWPKACPCGREFVDSDIWQALGDVLYQRRDTGAIVPLRELPVGALWDAWWMGLHTGWKGKDGICLMVKTPAGDWCPDQPSTSGTPWNRRGDVKANPPTVVCSPSILFDAERGGWHGYLGGAGGERPGILVEC